MLSVNEAKLERRNFVAAMGAGMGEIEGSGIGAMAAHEGQYKTRRSRGDHWRGNGPVTVAATPAQPSRWETLLEELGMDDGEALIALRAKDVASLRLTNFVRRHFGRWFVPEPVLAELDLLAEAEAAPLTSLKAGEGMPVE